MGRNVFVSFRFADGNDYKEQICEVLKKKSTSYDFSENEDRSKMTEETIKKYLYKKLKEVSVVIILLTPQALYYKKNIFGKYDDWCYDEVRYALEDREDNRTSGLIAVYVPEVQNSIITKSNHKCSKCGIDSTVSTISNFEHLFRKNMMNVYPEHKLNKCDGIYDSLYDSYCSLVSLDEFIKDPDKYIENAFYKKENVDKYKIFKHL